MTALILIVDDDPVDAELALWHLARANIGCTVCVQHTEHGLMLELGLHTPDLILCDLTIPGFDGFAALRIAKSLAPAVPVILWSSGGVPERQAQRARTEGAYICIAKEDSTQLVKLVRQILDEPGKAESTWASTADSPSERRSNARRRSGHY